MSAASPWTLTDDEAEALQGVVDRVSSWHDGAEPAVVREEFDRVAGEVGIAVESGLAEELCAQIIEDDERPDVREHVRIA